MKTKSGALAAASVAAAAASASAYSSPSCSVMLSNPRSQERQVSSKNGENSIASSSSSEQFTPRFDGLRFIETLVTAHR